MNTMKTAAFTVLFSAAVLAQNPAPQPAAPETPVLVGSRVGSLTSSYEDGGRRDPFGSLVIPKASVSRTSDAPSRPRPGLAGLALADVTVRGIVKSGAVTLAILETPSKQSFVAHLKDRLLDASVESIDAGGVVFAEQGAGGPQNKVRRVLRPSGSEDGQ